MNPYDPPTSPGLADLKPSPNPARTLLFVIGALLVIQGLLALPTGLFVGPHILGVAIVMFGYGVVAIWLGRRQFDTFGRYATIAWGMLAIVAIAAGIADDPSLLRNAAAIIILALVLATLGSVPLMAFIKQPNDSLP